MKILRARFTEKFDPHSLYFVARFRDAHARSGRARASSRSNKQTAVIFASAR
jgi:hypothetical protein